MARSLEELEDEILALQSSDKQKLLRSLIADIDTANEPHSDEVEKEWIKEAQRRFQEIEDGTVKTISAEESIRNARS